MACVKGWRVDVCFRAQVFFCGLSFQGRREVTVRGLVVLGSPSTRWKLEDRLRAMCEEGGCAPEIVGPKIIVLGTDFNVILSNR